MIKKGNLCKTFPTICQRPSLKTGKRRHVSANTITKSTLSDMKNNALYNRQIKALNKVKQKAEGYNNAKDKPFIKQKDKINNGE